MGHETEPEMTDGAERLIGGKCHNDASHPTYSHSRFEVRDAFYMKSLPLEVIPQLWLRNAMRVK